MSPICEALWARASVKSALTEIRTVDPHLARQRRAIVGQSSLCQRASERQEAVRRVRAGSVGSPVLKQAREASVAVLAVKRRRGVARRRLPARGRAVHKGCGVRSTRHRLQQSDRAAAIDMRAAGPRTGIAPSPLRPVASTTASSGTGAVVSSSWIEPRLPQRAHTDLPYRSVGSSRRQSTLKTNPAHLGGVLRPPAHAEAPSR